MIRPIIFSTVLLLVSASCGDKPKGDEPTLDSTPSVVAKEMPQNPMVSTIDIGLAVADNGLLMGSGTQKFKKGAPLFVGVTTSFVDEGAPLTVRLMKGDKTIETVSLVAGAPDAEKQARANTELPAAANLTPGEYQIEVLLGDVSQGIRAITITE